MISKEIAERLSKNADRDEKGLKEALDSTPFYLLQQPENFVDYAAKNGFGFRDTIFFLKFIRKRSDYINKIHAAPTITYKDVIEQHEKARASRIIIDRTNYIFYDAILSLIDILENEGRLKFGVKKAAGMIKHQWQKYQDKRKSAVEEHAWFTLLDHLSITNELILHKREEMYIAARDLMINQGVSDVQIKAHCVVALSLGKICIHTFRGVFRDIEKICKINYARLFADDEFGDVAKAFAEMCNLLGVKTEEDKYGCWTARDFNYDGRLRYKTACDGLLNMLRDDNIMEESARKAIELNPKTRIHYEKAIREEEEKQTREKIQTLSNKFKVKKL